MQSFIFSNVAMQSFNFAPKLHVFVSPFVLSPFGPPQSTWPCLDEHIEEYRLKRDDMDMDEVTDATGESTKIPRLQQTLKEFGELRCHQACQLQLGTRQGQVALQ